MANRQYKVVGGTTLQVLRADQGSPMADIGKVVSELPSGQEPHMLVKVPSDALIDRNGAQPIEEILANEGLKTPRLDPVTRRALRSVQGVSHEAYGTRATIRYLEDGLRNLGYRTPDEAEKVVPLRPAQERKAKSWTKKAFEAAAAALLYIGIGG